MPEREEAFKFNTSESNEDYQVQELQIDPFRLRQIRVENLSGRTYIKGTSENKIRVLTKRGGLNLSPAIEFKNEGREIEITAIPRNFNFEWNEERRWNRDWNQDWRWSPDPDMGQPFEGQPDFDFGEEPQRWNYPDNEAGREAYRSDRERYRDNRERVREEKRRVYEQQREEQRRNREQMREATRRAREQAREASRQPRGWGSWWNFDPSTFSEIARNIGETVSNIVSSLGDLYVEVPEGVELEVKSISGMVEISDIKNFCRIKNTSGLVRLNRVTGGMQLKSTSGRLEARELGGAVTAKVNSGHVSLRDCRLSALDLSLSSGHVEAELVLVEPQEGDYRISSSSGHIRLRLARDSHASIDCRTLNGRISIAPEIRSVEYRNRPGQNQSRIELNGGGRKVTVNAINGNVELSLYDKDQPDASPWPSVSSVGDWPAPPPPPAPPAPGFGSVPPVPPVAPMPPVPPVVPPVAPDMRTPFSTWERPNPSYQPPTPPDFVPPTPPYQPPASTQPQTLITPPPPQVWPSADESAQATPTEEKTAEPAEEARPAEDDKKTRQLEILRAIERGEISVEEGMARLSALDEG
jgi:DUF4097 and DUF4098 domain-containing protein YvlB